MSPSRTSNKAPCPADAHSGLLPPLLKQLGQPRDVEGDPPRLVRRQHLGLARLVVLLPQDSHGFPAMLTAYFDDTGTHAESKIVAVAGIHGTEGELRGLESEWRKHLERPLCGRKPPLSRFHMYDCQNSMGEFRGWNRIETDYFCHQLATAIIESGVSGYGMACSRKDWDDLVTGDTRAVLGDPEGICVRNCFMMACKWAQQSSIPR